MHFHRAAVAAAVLTALLPSTPASATPPYLDVIFNVTFSDDEVIPGNHVAVASCRAAVVIGAATQVPLATKVTCSINDTTRTQVTPGGASATTVVTVEPHGPVVACVTGEAVVMETEPDRNELFLVEGGPICQRYPDT